jgi:hypothetical protein
MLENTERLFQTLAGDKGHDVQEHKSETPDFKVQRWLQELCHGEGFGVRISSIFVDAVQDPFTLLGLQEKLGWVGLFLIGKLGNENPADHSNRAGYLPARDLG